jgi:hypothetical protein
MDRKVFNDFVSFLFYSSVDGGLDRPIFSTKPSPVEIKYNYGRKAALTGIKEKG